MFYDMHKFCSYQQGDNKMIIIIIGVLVFIVAVTKLMKADDKLVQKIAAVATILGFFVSGYGVYLQVSSIKVAGVISIASKEPTTTLSPAPSITNTPTITSPNLAPTITPTIPPIETSGPIQSSFSPNDEYMPNWVTEDWLSNDISESNNQNIIELNLFKAGKVHISVRAYIDYMNVSLLDTDKSSSMADLSYFGGNGNEPKVQHIEIDLEPGKYYLRFQKRNSNGKYDYKLAYKDAFNQEFEPNNTFDSAQSYKIGDEINGFMPYNDDYDYYKVEINEAGRVHINAKVFMDYLNVDLLLDDGSTPVSSLSYFGGSSSEPKLNTITCDIEKGIYYIRVKKRSYTGIYVITSEFITANKTEFLSNDTLESATNIELNDNLIGFISATNFYDYYVFNIDQASQINIDVISYIDYLNVDLLKDDGSTPISNLSYFGGSFIEPKKKTISIQSLESGKYYLRCKIRGNTGKYELYIYE